jgi:hypothetical protein
MSDDAVVLWRRCCQAHDLCCEIVQIAEGYFEMVVLDAGKVSIREASDEVSALIERAEELLHTPEIIVQNPRLHAQSWARRRRRSLGRGWPARRSSSQSAPRRPPPAATAAAP